MKVIFLADVPRVGKKHDVKDVNSGYAMNFLFPRKLAIAATAKALVGLESRKKEIAVERKVQHDLLLKNLETLKEKTIVIKSKANEQGHLFSAIHKKEILEAMKEQNHAKIGEEFIILEKPIKAIGEYEIPIEIGKAKSAFKLRVEQII